jgi:hypothetical protein
MEDIMVHQKIQEGIIVDDFFNKQYYYAGYFMSLEEGRDNKLNSILK